MPEFKLGVQEMAEKPATRLGAQHSGPDCCRAGPRNHRSRLQHGSIVAQNLGIADPGVDHRHMRTLVPEHAHDRVELGPTLGELGSDRVAEPVLGDRGAAVAMAQARTTTGITPRIVELITPRHLPTTTP